MRCRLGLPPPRFLLLAEIGPLADKVVSLAGDTDVFAFVALLLPLFAGDAACSHAAEDLSSLSRHGSLLWVGCEIRDTKEMGLQPRLSPNTSAVPEDPTERGSLFIAETLSSHRGANGMRKQSQLRGGMNLRGTLSCKP